MRSMTRAPVGSRRQTTVVKCLLGLGPTATTVQQVGNRKIAPRDGLYGARSSLLTPWSPHRGSMPSVVPTIRRGSTSVGNGEGTLGDRERPTLNPGRGLLGRTKATCIRAPQPVPAATHGAQPAPAGHHRQDRRGRPAPQGRAQHAGPVAHRIELPDRYTTIFLAQIPIRLLLKMMARNPVRLEPIMAL